MIGPIGFDDPRKRRSVVIGGTGGGAAVATFGWKMYEDEHERIMQEQDVQEILQRIREAALQDPADTQDFLKEHPALASQLSAALFSAAGSAGMAWGSPQAPALRARGAGSPAAGADSGSGGHDPALRAG